MNSLLLVTLLSCGPTNFVNQSAYKINTQDKQHLKAAQKRCPELYKQSPCLKTFIKRDVGIYWAICGAVK